MSFALIGHVSLFFLSFAGFRFCPHFPFLPFSFSRPPLPLSLIPSLSVFGASKRRTRWTNKPSCKRKRGETETDDGPVTRSSGRGRVCEINNFHGPAKNNTRSVTSRLRKRLLRNAGRRDTFCCANFFSHLLNTFGILCLDFKRKQVSMIQNYEFFSLTLQM